MASIGWDKMDKNVQEIFTKSKKTRETEKKAAAKKRVLQEKKDAKASGSKDAKASDSKDAKASGSKDAKASDSKDAKASGSKDAKAAAAKDAKPKGVFGDKTDAEGNYKADEKELKKEKELKERDVMAEVQGFKAVKYAGMCQPCLKGCKKCAKGFLLTEDGSCVKGCRVGEETITDEKTGVNQCKKDNKPRLVIKWGSKKQEKDLMDDVKVNKRKTDRKAAISSGDADGDLIDAVAMGKKSVDEEAEALD
jgi:hypothetical protein